jgi:hypothetical protein
MAPRDAGYRTEGGQTPDPERRSTENFLVSRSASALRSRNSRYTDLDVSKTYWTKDDHDNRFIVRLIVAGRALGRCWDRYTHGQHTEYLCKTAYRLMCWFRVMARIVNANNGMGRWRKAQAEKWYEFLCDIRRQRSAGRKSLTHSIMDSAQSSSVSESSGSRSKAYIGCHSTQ